VDSPENALKIPHPKTELKCTAINETHSFFLKLNGSTVYLQHCLAATLRAHWKLSEKGTSIF
jgi:hypothetical protein